MEYTIVYNYLDGKPIAIDCPEKRISFPICEANSDYQDFLKWNSEQEVPLDLKSTIEVPKPEPARDLAVEVTTIDERVTVLEEEKETLKLQVEALEVSMIGVKEEPLEEKLP